jgi:hypothetical protein
MSADPAARPRAGVGAMRRDRLVAATPARQGAVIRTAGTAAS